MSARKVAQQWHYVMSGFAFVVLWTHLVLRWSVRFNKVTSITRPFWELINLNIVLQKKWRIDDKRQRLETATAAAAMVGGWWKDRDGVTMKGIVGWAQHDPTRAHAACRRLVSPKLSFVLVDILESRYFYYNQVSKRLTLFTAAYTSCTDSKSFSPKYWFAALKGFIC